jgi:DDE superfamily endonuclease
MAWKRASMAAALGYHPAGSKARLCFQLQADSYDTDSLIEVLEKLKGFYTGQQVVLLWDGLGSHWSHKVRAHLDAQRHWLTVERLPAYAPSSTRSGTCGPTSREARWPTAPATPSPRSPTRPSTASSGSATATALWSGSLPTLACPSRTRHPKVKGPITVVC